MLTPPLTATLLRAQINACARAHGTTRLPWVWDVLIKYVLPAVLLALLVAAAASDAQLPGGHSGNPGWLQVRSSPQPALQGSLLPSLACSP